MRGGGRSGKKLNLGERATGRQRDRVIDYNVLNRDCLSDKGVLE